MANEERGGHLPPEKTEELQLELEHWAYQMAFSKMEYDRVKALIERDRGGDRHDVH